jgi:alkylated DNA repair dioxygenase AlkB
VPVATSPWVVGELERRPLDATSWVDLGRGWLRDPGEVYADLTASAPWQQNQVWRYDHHWSEPRLSAWLSPAAHPALTEAHRRLRAHYGVDLTGVSLNWYRDGRDAMASHRDSDLRWCDDTVIAILTLGAPRPWVLTPRSGGDPVDVRPGPGDLLVMGGRAQRDWLHGVPRVPGLHEGRISVQWRWTSRQGRPEVGGSSNAPRRYGGGR